MSAVVNVAAIIIEALRSADIAAEAPGGRLASGIVVAKDAETTIKIEITKVEGPPCAEK